MISIMLRAALKSQSDVAMLPQKLCVKHIALSLYVLCPLDAAQGDFVIACAAHITSRCSHRSHRQKQGGHCLAISGRCAHRRPQAPPSDAAPSRQRSLQHSIQQ